MKVLGDQSSCVGRLRLPCVPRPWRQCDRAARSVSAYGRHGRGIRTTVPSLLCAASLIALYGSVSAADITLPLVAPVKLLPGTAATTPTMMSAARTRPAPLPTTPSGRLPQYQLGPAQLVKTVKHDPLDSAIRFQLILPDGPLLITAHVTIDDEPFVTVRDRRIARLLEQQAAGESSNSTDAPVSAVEAARSPTIAAVDGATDLVSRLRRYPEATGRTLTREEIDWWLTTAVEGPPVLWLKEGFQRFRADQGPMFAVLDRNHDGAIDADELAHAEESLLTTDANRNEIVEFSELGTFTRGKPAATTWDELPRITSIADAPEQRTRRFDLQLTIAFHPTQPDESRLRLVKVSDAAAKRIQVHHASTTAIALLIDHQPITLEAVQVAGLDSDQISVGSVNDGYPWLPALDLNDDGRLTIRERRLLQKQLATFDTNQDGILCEDEAVAPFRIALGLGPTVHRHLASIRSVHPRSSIPLEPGPEWFTRMDRNKDRDLTRAEFPGTDEQFSAMDQDADKLIDVAEAVAYEKAQPRPNVPEITPPLDAATSVPTP